MASAVRAAVAMTSIMPGRSLALWSLAAREAKGDARTRSRVSHRDLRHETNRHDIRIICHSDYQATGIDDTPRMGAAGQNRSQECRMSRISSFASIQLTGPACRSLGAFRSASSRRLCGRFRWHSFSAPRRRSPDLGRSTEYDEGASR